MWIEFEYPKGQRNLVDLDGLCLFSVTELKNGYFSIEASYKYFDNDTILTLTVGSQLWCDQQLDRITEALIKHQDEECVLIIKPEGPKPEEPPTE